jgi:hypothetical protein
MHCQIDQIVSDIETRWTAISNVIEVFLAVIKLARVDSLALCKKEQPIEECDDIRPWLMDCEDDRPLVRLG